MQTSLFGQPAQPLAVAYGLGVDSTAMLIEMFNRGIRPDVITHANVGSENKGSYAFRPIFDTWLESVGFPPITDVWYVPKNFKNWPPYYTLEQNCLTNGTLPSISFSFQFKSCSQKWKAAPQHAWMKTWSPAVEYWRSGGKVRKAIGYDSSPRDIKRCDTYVTGAEDDKFYEYWYPLQEWGIDRIRCAQIIETAGLVVPPKSSCIMCAAMQPEEVSALDSLELARIVRMEARARPRFKSAAMKGLWGRDSKKRPGSMTEFIRAKGLLAKEVIDRIENETPADIVRYQEGFAAGDNVVPFAEFSESQLIQILRSDGNPA